MLSSHIQNTLRALADSPPREFGETFSPPISVNKITSRAGSFYEKIRYLFDYKDEHTIRRSAVERQLKRKLTFGENVGTGTSLLHELVAGGYLANESVTENTGTKIQEIIDRFIWLYEHVSGNSRRKERVISLAATEIDRFLHPQPVDDHVAEGFFKTVRPLVEYPSPIAAGDLDMQVFIACRRSLLAEDRDSLFYTLWLKYVPEWKAMVDKKALESIAPQCSKILDAINNQLKHPLGWHLVPKLKNYGIYFSLVREIIGQYGLEAENLLQDEATLKSRVEQILNAKYKREYERTRKSSIRAVIYVFFTKIIIALILELPYEIYFLTEINYLALGANVIVHPILLFLITRGAAKPDENNTERIMKGLIMVIKGEGLDRIHVKQRGTGAFFNSLLALVYLILFAFTFGVIVWGLQKLGFNGVSIILFVFFLTLISYFGLRVRYNAKKWIVAKEKGTFLLLWTIFTLPIVRAGRWLSRTFSTINIFVFIMDFIIETPFKMVLSFLDSFLSFLREKEEEPY